MSTATCCSGRPRSSTIFANESTENGRRFIRPQPQTSLVICCLWWTTSSAPSPPTWRRLKRIRIVPGVELIHKQLLSLLEKRGVAPIASVGSEFNPEYQQAVETSPAEDGEYDDGTVVEELRRGYTLHGRLLRPAMVKVAKA